MNGPLNSSKGSITSCFVLPVILKTAYVEGEYRVGVVWNGRNGAAISIYFRCSDAETFVDCLYALADASPRWYKPLRVSGWTMKNGICWAADIGHSIAAQNELAAMPREAFQEYKKGTLRGELSLDGMEQAVLAVRREE